MQVLKFGGSSVANKENQERVLEIVKDVVAGGEKTAIVLSALGGITDMLLKAAKQAVEQDPDYQKTLDIVSKRHIELVQGTIPIQHQSSLLTKVKTLCNDLEDICKGVFLVKELSLHTTDSIISYGEVLSTTIFSQILIYHKIKNIWCDSRDFICTNSHFGNASVDIKTTTQRLSDFVLSNDNNLFVFPGFIGRDANGNVTTLGRGGSDYTAAIIGAALQAREIQIWTDVSGMMTADPRIVKHAKPINHISYQEALELSHFGAKVIYPRTVTPAMLQDIPILVKNTFAPKDEGTRIYKDSNGSNNLIRGISSKEKVALLTLEGSGMIGIPGTSRRLFEALAKEDINVILITQSSSEYNICVVVDAINSTKAKQAIETAFTTEIEKGRIDPVKVELNLSVIAIVGDKMNGRTGMSGMMFSSLGKNNINVRAIAQGSSERNISAVIADKDVKKALNVLHEEFFENTYKQINLYICGTGNVGNKLITQLLNQYPLLKKNLGLQVRIMGFANSRKMLLLEDRLRNEDWEKQLSEKGVDTDLKEFIGKIITLNRRNSVFVDVTASADVAGIYAQLLQNSISVIACNKIACSSNYDNYHSLKETAQKHNASFLYETNVGAALPIMKTLGDLIQSGDELNKVEAVLSGSLNFIFNTYDGKKPFADVVRLAGEEGYTEPDPRLDLSGTDVMRKILILARESGKRIEMSEVENKSFMPESCMKGSVASFYREMEKHEDHFKKMYEAAQKKNCKLKFVARFENGKATTGLQEVPEGSDFYHLYGKDNIVLFYTKRYPEQPLVIKGAGAGADVTASGVFADILRASRN